LSGFKDMQLLPFQQSAKKNRSSFSGFQVSRTHCNRGAIDERNEVLCKGAMPVTNLASGSPAKTNTAGAPERVRDPWLATIRPRQSIQTIERSTKVICETIPYPVCVVCLTVIAREPGDYTNDGRGPMHAACLRRKHGPILHN